MSEDFGDMIRQEFGDEALPKDFWDEFYEKVAEADTTIRAMDTEKLIGFTEEVLGGLELYQIVYKDPNGGGYGVNMPMECFQNVRDKLEAHKPGMSEDLEQLAMAIATHLTMGHLPEGIPWDPIQWVMLHRLAFWNMKMNLED